MIDLARFGLTSRPFRATPDTHAYQPHQSADAALDGLRDAYDGREGLALLDGEPGLGKTLVALKFLEGLDASVPRLFVPAARFSSARDLYQTLLFDHDLPYQGFSEHEVRLLVTERLLKRLAGPSPVVIVLDEAQHLSAELLEELRLLGNLESRSAKAAFVVLVAQPTLRPRLARPECQAFAQRLGSRFALAPLTAEEADGYLAGQLRHAGARDPDALFLPEARGLCAQAAGGVPRVLNQLAQTALRLAAEAGERQIDPEAVLEAADRLGLSVAESDEGEDELPDADAEVPQRRSA